MPPDILFYVVCLGMAQGHSVWVVTASSAILELLADLVMDVLLYMFGPIKFEKNYKTSSGNSLGIQRKTKLGMHLWTCFPKVSFRFPTCFLNVPNMFHECFLQVSCMFPAGFQHVLCRLPACVLEVSCVFPACFLQVSCRCRFLVCSLEVSCRKKNRRSENHKRSIKNWKSFRQNRLGHKPVVPE